MSRVVRLRSSANRGYKPKKCIRSFFWPFLNIFVGLRVSRLTERVIKNLNHQLITLKIGCGIHRSNDNATNDRRIGEHLQGQHQREEEHDLPAFSKLSQPLFRVTLGIFLPSTVRRAAMTPVFGSPSSRLFGIYQLIQWLSLWRGSCDSSSVLWPHPCFPPDRPQRLQYCDQGPPP